MIEDPVSHTLKPFDFTHLIENVPKVKMLDYIIDNVQFNPPLDSSDMDIPNWQFIANSIADNYDNYDGFVVLHGTDTMAYTASALSFMLQNLQKPVIITGSQLPIGEVRTDGEENLITALQIAASKRDDGSSTVQEVAILFENYLWRGNRSTKRSAGNFNAFRSSNYPELGKIGLAITFNYSALRQPKTSKPLQVFPNMDNSILAIDLFPGLRPEIFHHLLSTPNVKGIILRTFGAGNAPTNSWFLDAIKSAVARNIVMVNVTQCLNGGVDTKRYLTGDMLTAAGVISGHDITFEAALAKMMHLFGRGFSADEVKELFERSIAGEMSGATNLDD